MRGPAEFVLEVGKFLLVGLVGGALMSEATTALATPPRTEESIRATAFGRFDPGVPLLRESFSPGEPIPRTGSSSKRSQLVRTYLTNDPAAFQRAFVEHARRTGAQLVQPADSKVESANALQAWVGNASPRIGAIADGAMTRVGFSDLSQQRQQPVPGTPRWLVTVSTRDGPCEFLLTDCVPLASRDRS